MPSDTHHGGMIRLSDQVHTFTAYLRRKRPSAALEALPIIRGTRRNRIMARSAQPRSANLRAVPTERGVIAGSAPEVATPSEKSCFSKWWRTMSPPLNKTSAGAEIHGTTRCSFGAPRPASTRYVLVLPLAHQSSPPQTVPRRAPLHRPRHMPRPSSPPAQLRRTSAKTPR
jgi:hypothetical protein